MHAVFRSVGGGGGGGGGGVHRGCVHVKKANLQWHVVFKNRRTTLENRVWRRRRLVQGKMAFIKERGVSEFQ